LASASSAAQSSTAAQLSASAVALVVSQQNRQPIPLNQTASAMARNLLGQNLLWEIRLDISLG
jgi:hypothetical protein